jgi:hypothetical protein
MTHAQSHRVAPLIVFDWSVAAGAAVRGWELPAWRVAAPGWRDGWRLRFTLHG